MMLGPVPKHVALLLGRRPAGEDDLTTIGSSIEASGVLRKERRHEGLNQLDSPMVTNSYSFESINNQQTKNGAVRRRRVSRET
jgi:hypothetical protein